MCATPFTSRQAKMRLTTLSLHGDVSFVRLDIHSECLFLLHVKEKIKWSM